MERGNEDGRTRQVGLVVLCLVLAASVASAAGETTVRLEADGDSLAVGESTTIEVVVADAAGGAGSVDLTVSLGNPGVANLTGATFAGEPAYSDAAADGDGDLTLTATGADTTDSGSVTVATVEVTGVAPGSTDLSLIVTDVGDEDGRSYAVTGTHGDSLSVTDGSDRSAGSGGDNSNGDSGDDRDGSVESTSTATGTVTPTETARDTATSAETVRETTTANGTDVPVTSATDGTPEPPTDQRVTVLALAGLALAVVVALVFWRRR